MRSAAHRVREATDGNDSAYLKGIDGVNAGATTLESVRFPRPARSLARVLDRAEYMS